MAALVDVVDQDSHIESDAVPVTPSLNTPNEQAFTIPAFSQTLKGVDDETDDDILKQTADEALSDYFCSDESVDRKDAISGQQQLQAGDFKVENSAVEIGNSAVHFGHKIKQRTDISVTSATSVVVDRSQRNYIIYPNSKPCEPTSGPPSTPPAIIAAVQEFNRHRYLNRLALITPLPWCARFSPHLDKIYTSVQLVSSDRFDRRSSRINIPLEQIFDDKHGDESAGNNDLASRPCRVLIEGNPGYGKTTLTLRLALDWASRKAYMHRFQLVFLIQLRYFKGDLQSYIFDEFFPRHEDNGRDDWWRHVKENQEQILFILDGLDELPREHRSSIDMLLKGNLLDRSSLVVTSRLVPSDDNVLSCFNRLILIKGFSEGQTEQFIHNYFQAINEPQQGSKLKTVLNGPRWCGRHLTACPLTCQLLCIVFKDEGDHIINKITEVYRDLVAWLIRRALNSRDSSSGSVTAQDYERALRDFGNICIQALSNGQVNFTADQIFQLPANGGHLILQSGLLVQSHTGMTMRSPKSLCYQPIHKTFLEYLGAYYLSYQVEENLLANMDALQSEHVTRESLQLLFKFLAGLLGENAATLFRFRYLSDFDLPTVTLFELLHESGATAENVRAISSILDDEIVLVQSKRVELEAWARLLAEPDCVIRCLKFVWVSIRQSASSDAEIEPLVYSALDRFFTAFQTNTSVVCLTINSAIGLFPNEKEAGAIAAFTAQALKKSQLRHFSLQLVGDTWSAVVINAVNRALNYRIAAPSLVSLNINVDLGNSHIASFCQGLRQYTSIKSLVLSKLSCEPEGYVHIASLLRSVHHLAVSLNLIKTLPPPSRNPIEEGSPQDLGTFSTYFKQTAQQRAGIKVSDHQSDDSPENPQPNDENHSLNGVTSSSALSILRNGNPISYNLHDGLMLSASLGSQAVGLPGLTVAGCRSDSHLSGFHSLFVALKDPECQLVRLDLTGCCLGPDDFDCLGEALRSTSTLKAMRFARLKKFEEVLPIILNSRLSWLDLSSGSIALNDVSTIHLVRALSSASQLTTLSLAGWKFSITKPQVIQEIVSYMKTSRLQELSLTNCRIDLTMPKDFQMRNRRKSHPSIQSLNLSINKSDRFARFFRSLSQTSLTSFSSSSSSSPSGSSSSLPSLSASFPKTKDGANSRMSLVDSSSSLSDSGSTSCDHRSSSEGEFWPHLAKLSLASLVTCLQVEETRDEHYITGPELFNYMEGLRNLSELSVSVKPSSQTMKPDSSVQEMNDSHTRRFFSLLQRQLGRTLTQLRMSCCALTWNRPTQTAFHVIRHLQKCEKLVSVAVNFVKFRVCNASASFDGNHKPVAGTNEDSSHCFLDAIVCGVPLLEEFNICGVELTSFQASSLALKIRDKWKGSSLRIHTRNLSENVLQELLHSLKIYPKFYVEYIGGFRGTVLVRRRTQLCGLFRYLLTSSNSESDASTNDHDAEDNTELLCFHLPPGHRNLFGLTPFDFSIMQAHLWNNTV